MKEPTHARKGKQVMDLGSGQAETHKSVNQAKRASRKLTASGSIVRRLDRKQADRNKAYDGARRSSVS